MRTIMSMLGTLLLLAMAAFASTQGAEEQNLVSAIVASQLTTLLKLLQTAGLDKALEGKGPFTVMAPSDSAFAKLDPKVLTNLQSDADALTQILTFHVIQASIPSENITDGMMIPTLLGSNLTFTLVDGTVRVNGAATVTQADVMATNGLVHIIDTVLMPPPEDKKTAGGINKDLVDLAYGEGLSTLVFLVELAGLQAALRGPGPLTIFAPRDTAGFASLDPYVMDRAMTDPEFLVKLISYHVIPGMMLLSSNVTGVQTVATLEGGSMNLSTAENGTILLNGGNASVLYSDMLASNGVLHIIDRVLVPMNLMDPSDTILQVAEKKKLNTFLSLVKEANLFDALNMTGPYTVFAPVDEAFAAVPEELLKKLKADPSELKKVLQYHVVSGLVTSKNFENDLQMPSLQGDALRLNIYPKASGVGMVTVDGSPARRLDVTASNGVLHIIERVLLPPKGNVADLIALEKDLTTFSKALTTANMTDYLITEGNITVLAPVDTAFAALPEDALTRLMGDKELLTKVLMEHIIPATVYREGMTWSSVPSVGGPRIAFVKDASADIVLATPMTVTGLEGTEISATNGVIQKVKKVLFS